MDRTRAGIASTVGAYAMWGCLPLYLRLLRGVGALEIVAHRIVWSAAIVVVVVAALRTRFSIAKTRRTPRGWGWVTVAASAVALCSNWLIFVWAVNAGHGVDASLGYFINPLVSIGLGALVLREELTRVRWLAVVCALGGVVWLTWRFGQVPWIGLSLAVTFGAYGLLRKTSRFGAFEGLVLEIALLAPAGLAYLGWLAARGDGSFLAHGARGAAVLLLAGPVTVVPLLLFAVGARRIPLWLVGILQYLGPTLQLVVGVLVGGERFGPAQLVGYMFVWFAFLLASAESLWAARRPRPAAAAAVRAAQGTM